MKDVLISSKANLVIGLEFEYQTDLVNVHLLPQKGFDFLAVAFAEIVESSNFAFKVYK